ncbi:hypothetical protein ACIBCT_39075 [Streptosporangium sp. NPDC050855]|uniref:hypothetical protein n=1 Tax=Streptosporangium sp. NPDC050855 TaxID=3366194 RepID=UPI0037AA161E
MTRPPSPGPQWSGDMLRDPEMMAAFAAQLRGVLSDQAGFINRVRRDAEAMWKENPPEGYGTFEAWWRHQWVCAPFDEIQQLIEKAAEKTHALEARYRRGRHEIPAARQAAAQARRAPSLPRGPVDRPAQPRPAGPRAAAPPLDGDFLDLATREGRSNRRRPA